MNHSTPTPASVGAQSWEDAVRWLLTQPAQAALVRDCFYDTPRLAAAQRYATSAEWQAVQALLPATAGALLEVGAGHGILTAALATAGWRVTAVEPDASDLVGAGAIRSLVAESGVQVTVIEAVGEALPVADASMDCVVARQVLHHAGDLKKLLSEVARVLRPGGTFLALREHVLSKETDLPEFLQRHPLHFLYGGEHAYTLAVYRAAITEVGLTIDRTLGSFDTVINFAPHTQDSLRAALIERAGQFGFGALLRVVLARPWCWRVFLKVLTHLDSRPGRLYSFVCYKPASAQ